MSRRVVFLLIALFALAVFALLAGGCLRDVLAPPPSAPVPSLDGGPVAPPPPGTVRLAAFNVEFLFDGEGDEGQADFPWKGDPAAARAHRDSVARVIRSIDADVLVMPEVENEEVLEMLIRESLADMGYRPYFVQGTDRFTGQDVGILARVPVEAVGRTDERAPVGTTRQTYGVSKNIWARVDLDGVPATIIGVHFLARPDDPTRKPQREAQAEVIRRLVVQEMAAGRAVAVMGDLNDFDPDVPDIAGSTPISDVLAIVKSAGPGPEDDLHNVMADVPQIKRYTAFWDRNRNGEIDSNEYSAIDHVLLSPRLYRALREVQFVHNHDPRLVSDHFPIVVTLALGADAEGPAGGSQ